MKIAILYICTGKYDLFWKDFYLSSEKYFLCNAEKSYFVFSDAEEIFAEEEDNVYKIFQKNLGWPGNTLFRYEIFLTQKYRLKTFDYIFFLNANMLFLQPIEDDILPPSGLLVVQHPGYYSAGRNKFPYDRNKKSLAYISPKEGEVYICGGFNGGTASSFLKMADVIAKNTKEDYSHDIVARWHDESHINHYILNHEYKLLSPEYAYPEGVDLPFECKVLIRDKNKYGGHEFLRDQNEHVYIKIIKLLKRAYKFMFGD